MINELKSEEARMVDSMQLNILTLERNSVLVARLAKNSGYDLDELQSLKKSLQNIFPNHQIFVWWDDIEFMAINDKSYSAERMSLVNETTPNYY